jgi:hypothetical protein
VANSPLRATDLEGAIRVALKHSTHARRIRALNEIAFSVSREDIPRALELAALIEDRQLQAHFRHALLAHVAETDPQAAMRLAASLSYGQRTEATLAVLNAWVEHDVAAATEWVRALPMGPLRQQALQTLITTLASDNLPAASALLQEVPRAERNNLVAALFSQEAALAPETAAQLALQMHAGDPREQAVQLVASAWAMRDPAGAMRWAQELPDQNEKKRATRAVITQWAGADAKGAAEFATALPAGAFRDEAINAVAAQWAGKDARAAAQWVAALPAGAARDNALNNVMLQWVRADVSGAAAHAQTLSGRAQNYAYGQIASHWAATDPAAATQWATALPDNDARRKVIAGMSLAWAQHDPQKAAEFVATLADLETARPSAMNVLSQWVPSDPAAAASWAARFQEGPLQGDAIRTVMSYWAQKDRAAAAEWMQQLPEGTGRDAAVQAYVAFVSGTAPALAAPLVNEIRNTEVRHAHIESLAQTWLKLDRSAAVAWLNGTDLPAARKTELLSRKIDF